MKRALLIGGLVLVILVMGGCIMICREDAGDRPGGAVACAAACEPAPGPGGTPVEEAPARP